MKNSINGLLFFVLSAFVISCNTPKAKDETSPLTASWEEMEASAKGKTVTFMKYQGDKRANKHMEEYIIPTLLKRYGITLKIIPGQGKDIVSNIMSEKEAGETNGQVDLVWINGETFFQLRQIDGLFGPFTNKLPNSKYINYEDPIIKYDFQQEIGGYEAPWGKASFLMIADTNRVSLTPKSMADFEVYRKAHPGKFTFALDFSGYTLLKSWLVELAGGMQNIDGAFDQAKYDKYSTQLWDFINKNKQYFWKKGETFPASNVTVSQMFGSGELDFGMSFGIGVVDKGVKENLFPKSTISFVLKAGSIHNASYLGIPYNASNKAAAMVVCNFLISPEAQLEKCAIKNGGGIPVFDYNKIDKQWQAKYDAMPKLSYGLSEKQVLATAIKETHPQYMINVSEDFRKKVIEAK